jgi:hypothetical protein
MLRVGTQRRTGVGGTLPGAMKFCVRYGLPAGTHPDYEIDHLIPLGLGGSDDSSNLWPQPLEA